MRTSSVAELLAAVGQVVLRLDREFRVVEAHGLAPLAGEARAAEVIGRLAHAVFGIGVLRPGDPFRVALEAGRSRHAWRGLASLDGGPPRVYAISAAPIQAASGATAPSPAGYVVSFAALGGEGAPVPGGAVGGVLGRSPSMLRLFDAVTRLGRSLTTVLLSGETGAGKGVLARAIHDASPHRAGAFVTVNCAALAESLLESELFGHAKGAFSGAVEDRVGRFEEASSGTIVLDEIGDLSLRLQVKILRVLHERRFERVGENHTRSCDARFLAATHRDLSAGVVAGTFREDLYHRLCVVHLTIPPLRDRIEDVPILAEAHLARMSARQGHAFVLSEEALTALAAYPWPGNVRELENALEHAGIFCDGGVILREDLPSRVLGPTPIRGDDSTLSTMSAAIMSGPSPRGRDLRAEAPTAAELRERLIAMNWSRHATAASFGVSRSTLWRWMRERGLK